MSHSAVSLLPAGRSALRAHRAVWLAFDRALETLPPRPDSLAECAALFVPGEGPAPVELVRALRSLRDAAFLAPGRDVEMRSVFTHSVAAAVFAASLADLRNRPRQSAATAALLHRIGESLALAALSRAESETATRLDTPSKAQLLARHARALAARAVRAWELDPHEAAAVLGWRGFGEFPAADRLSGIVYGAHLLGLELIESELTTPGLEAALAELLGLSATELDALRLRSVDVRALLRGIG